MSSVGAVFQLHNEVADLIQAVASFRRHMPDSPVVLIGNSPAHLAEAGQSTALSGLASQPYIGPLHEIEAKDFHVDAGELHACIRIQLENLRTAFTAVEAQYSLFLHPDHRVVRRIDLRNPVDLEINLVNELRPELLQAVENEFDGTVSVPYWGIWGYLNRNAVLEVCDWLLGDDVLDRFLQIDRIFIYDDVLLSVAFQLRGFSVGTRHFTRELRRGGVWLPWRRPSLLHQVQLMKRA